MDTTIQDSLNIMAQHTQNNVSDGRVDWWMWIAIAEFVILLILVLSTKSLPKNERLQRFKNESMNHEIDFNNTISSAFHAEELYDELKVKCHPDRFPMNPEKSRTAEMFFQEITKNKHNMKRLLELKEQAKHELNINF